VPRRYIALIAPVLLVACHDTSGNGSGVDKATIAVDEPDAGSNSQSPPPAAANATGEPRATGAPRPSANAIPAAFHGRWALVAGDCGPDAGAAKGLLTISGGMLRFYESVGKPVIVTYPTPSRMEGRFSFSGEGMDWSKDMVLKLEGKGDTLIRSERDPAASYTYRRCPT